MEEYRRNEVLLTGEDTSLQWNLCVWDPGNGTCLTSYKGGMTELRTANVISRSYLVSAQKKKPLLNVWKLNRHEQIPLKITTPGKLNCLKVSPVDGRFIIGSIGESLHLWQTSTGSLLGIFTGHFQDVTCLAWTDDASFFISAGKDGAIIVWNLADTFSSEKEPYRRWNDSTLEITDLAVGKGGPRSRIYTASRDQNCRVYDLPSGQLLLEVTFSQPLSAVAIDPSETWIFLGTSTGDIHIFSLRESPRREDSVKIMMPPDKKNTFNGHNKTVTCLSVSIDGSTLASGSEDTDVRLWHIKSRQSLRTIPHKGSVNTVEFLSPPPRGMLDRDEYLQDIVISQLQKTVVAEDVDETLQVLTPYGVDEVEDEEENKTSAENNNSESFKSEEIERLRRINFSLYRSAVEAVLK